MFNKEWIPSRSYDQNVAPLSPAKQIPTCCIDSTTPHYVIGDGPLMLLSERYGEAVPCLVSPHTLTMP